MPARRKRKSPRPPENPLEVTPREKEMDRVITSPICGKIVKCLLEKGPMTQTEIAREIDAAPASARYHLLKLVKVGTVVRDGDRPGPKGITEKLYEIAAEGDDSVLTVTKRQESQQDIEQRMFAELTESIRVANRILAKESKRSWGMNHVSLELTGREMLEMSAALNKLVVGLRKKFSSRRSRKSNAKRQRVCLYLAALPEHQPAGKRELGEDDPNWFLDLEE
jgi:predicted ArsR family transcriptional regulator